MEDVGVIQGGAREVGFFDDGQLLPHLEVVDEGIDAFLRIERYAMPIQSLRT